MFAAQLSWNITARDVTATVAMEGSLDLAGASTLYAHVDRVLLTPPDVLILDLGQVAFIDSQGIAALIAIRREAPKGIQLVIGPRSGRVAQVLRTMRLEASFEFHPPLAAA